MEEELNIPLFFRSPRGVELTEAGYALKSSLRIYMNAYEHAIDTVEQLKTNTKHNVSLGMTSAFNDIILPENFIKNFISEIPDVNLIIVSYHDEMTEKSRAEHKLHLGFFCVPHDTQQFYSALNHKAKVKLIAGKNHRFAKRRSIKLGELRNESVISLNSNLSPLGVLFELCRQNGARMETVLSPADVGLRNILCETGRRLAFGTGDQAAASNLVAVDIEDVTLYWEFDLVVNKFAFLTEAEEKFIAYAKRTIK
jgi:DNA-binding transcriptional LysR family regulator